MEDPVVEERGGDQPVVLPRVDPYPLHHAALTQPFPCEQPSVDQQVGVETPDSSEGAAHGHRIHEHQHVDAQQHSGHQVLRVARRAPCDSRHRLRTVAVSCIPGSGTRRRPGTCTPDRSACRSAGRSPRPRGRDAGSRDGREGGTQSPASRSRLGTVPAPEGRATSVSEASTPSRKPSRTDPGDEAASVHADPPPIEHHSLLSDQRTAAIVTPDARGPAAGPLRARRRSRSCRGR